MNVQMALDSVWVLVSALLVFFMHAGFALVEAGFCQRKNAVVVLTKNLAVVALSSILFYLIGFGVMFGDGNSWIGASLFAPAATGAGSALPDNLPLFVFLFFQMVFAATAATIVSGAVAERIKVSAFMIFVVFATVFIYPVVGHWVWGGGVLSTLGFHDFAGSTVVHAVGGAMALAGVIALGPRIGKYDEDGNVVGLPPHNLPLAALGVLILWVGWFGFNGGSTLSADAGAVAPVILSTNLAAAGGFAAVLGWIYWRTGGKLDLSFALNGALGGLVAITAGADVIAPMEAILVGAMGGMVVVGSTLLLDKLRLDDPVGAIAVHLGAGLFGTIAVGLFANSGDVVGLFHGGGFSLLGIQLAGAFSGALFAFLSAAAVWFPLRATFGIRVSEKHEIEGLDLAECGISAYHFDVTHLVSAEVADLGDALVPPPAEPAAAE